MTELPKIGLEVPQGKLAAFTWKNNELYVVLVNMKVDQKTYLPESVLPEVIRLVPVSCARRDT